MSITTLYWTYAMLRDKVLRDLDLEEETFISSSEMLSFANEAIDRCEQEVVTIYEDYFLDYEVLAIVSGQDEYELPPNIYAHKIRRMVFFDGNTVYKVKRLGDWKKFETYELDRANGNGVNLFDYFIRNAVPGAPTILFTPVPTTMGQVRIWYLRQSNRLEDPVDILDIPEGHNYVLAYMKMKCIEKETHAELTPGLQKAIADVETERKLMVETLTAMVPDAENEIEPDFTLYEEMT